MEVAVEYDNIEQILQGDRQDLWNYLKHIVCAAELA
jgi:hypothetical protein